MDMVINLGASQRIRYETQVMCYHREMWYIDRHGRPPSGLGPKATQDLPIS